MSEEKNIPPQEISQEQPENNELADATISSAAPVANAEQQQTINPKLQTQEDMEVHHHTHPTHGKKTWKDYFWEFLMLFLAVFCGFLAEYQLEHVIEHQREKELAKALYDELLDDSTVAVTKLTNRLEKEKDMDYLSSYFKDSSLTNLPREFYPAYTTSLYLINTYSFEPKDGILSQLKNSGSMRYFKSVALQKLLGDINVNINNVRTRNEQEYQYFSSPVKPFMLKYYDWSWIDNLRKEDTTANVLDVINNYRKSDRKIESKILNMQSLDRIEASNLILFYKQMMVSSRTLQYKNYILTNHNILQVLRTNYSFKNE